MEIIGYIGALCIGLILGLTGSGGSMLAVPILVYLLHINPTVATGYSLFIVGITSIFGVYQNYKKQLVDFKNGILFAIPSFIGVYLTRRFIVPKLPEIIIETSVFTLKKDTFLMLVFAIIMFLTVFSMLKKKKQTQITTYNKIEITLKTFIIGVIIGFVGAGGGFLIVPSLVLFAKLPIKKAIGTSLFVVAINSLIGFLGDIQTLNINWGFLLSFSALSIIGIFIGVYSNQYINEKQLKKGFAYFVFTMALFIFIKEMYLIF